MAPGTEGGFALNHESGEVMSVYDAAQIDAPKVVLAGSQYGTGSSRDWAAKGTYLLGVKAVVGSPNVASSPVISIPSEAAVGIMKS